MPYFYLEIGPPWAPRAPRGRDTTETPPRHHRDTTETRSEPKMPYFYLKKGPRSRKCLIFTYKRALGAENALFLPRNRAPGDSPGPRGPQPGSRKHHRDTTETPPRHHRDTTETPPRHHRDTLGTENALFLPKKRPSEPKMPYFYLQKGPRSRKCLIFT